jgi:lysozyme family protein
MAKPFEALRDEYLDLMSTMTYTKTTAIEATAKKLLKFKDRYAAVTASTGVPIIWLAAINERESSSNFKTYLGNGDPLNKKTTHVPKGRGPFDSWESGAIDALNLDGVASVKNWTWAMAAYMSERYNGFGPRARGRRSGYLWAGTSVYNGGKYIADGVWSPGTWDIQLGTIPMMRAMIKLDPTLDIPGWPTNVVADPAIIPSPEGLDGGEHGVAWLQASLNALVPGVKLVVDGSYGRRTTAAVKTFQATNGLDQDGIAGPLTIAAIVDALSKKN